MIGLYEHERGPVVPWSTDPTSRFSDHAHLWALDRGLPLQAPPPTAAAAAARTTSGAIRSASAQPKSLTDPGQAPSAPVAAQSAAVGRAR
ncbi:hypothetical protein KV557_00170 [Kitasatospora aureofaciens]|uniref:hypothetical protein n=1 Tax=Kitasatospora aureofaciens TaxID=1894 RepID=UPI001C48DE8B|nr:hypothetical protein [Kitasatospora aureofaciens]MBV6695541.1 hypothetical protein [Kitasatospora aureofaciens]